MSAAGGTVIFTAGQLIYVPPTAFTGPDSFEFQVTDASGQTAVATVSVEVEDAVDPGEETITVLRG